METFETILVGERQLKLAFSIDSILEVEKNARQIIWGQPGPMDLETLTKNMSLLQVRLYLFKKALSHPDSGADPKESRKLYEEYIDVEHPDDGSRLEEFCEKIAMAVTLSQGFDGKKAKLRQDKKKRDLAEDGPGTNSSSLESEL